MPTNYNDNWSNINNKVNINLLSEGIILNMDTGVSWGQLFVQSQSTFFDLGFAVEFDVLSYSDTPAIRFSNNTISKPHIVTTGHWKITFKSDNITVLKDGVNQTHSLNDLIGSSKLKVFWELSSDTDVVKYNNFMIYSI